MFSTTYFYWSKLSQARKSSFSCTIIFIIAQKSSFERNEVSALVIKIFCTVNVHTHRHVHDQHMCVHDASSLKKSLPRIRLCFLIKHVWNPHQTTWAQSSCWVGDVTITLGMHTCFRRGKNWCVSPGVSWGYPYAHPGVGVVGGRCVSSCLVPGSAEPSCCCPRAQELQVLLEAMSASPLGAFLNDSIVGQSIVIPASNIHWHDI